MRAGHAEAVEDEQPVAGEQLARLGAAVERLERQPQELEPMRIELVVGDDNAPRGNIGRPRD
jgi:hypothetical protein